MTDAETEQLGRTTAGRPAPPKNTSADRQPLTPDDTGGQNNPRPQGGLPHEPHLALVEEELRAFFASARQRAAAMGSQYQALWAALADGAAAGKRFRPRMALTVYKGLGGLDFRLAATVGAAFELLHTALILHDDVIDRDFIRRGVPNLAGRYREEALAADVGLTEAEHRGMSAALIAGDLALFNSYRMLDRLPVAPDLKADLQELLDEAMFSSAAGELLDLCFSDTGEEISIAGIIEMDRLKTAVYSFEAPLQAGAVLAGAPASTVRQLAGIGRSLGIAYQITDDLLGVFGAEEATGKTTLGDLREGKRTVLIAHAMSRPQWPEIAGLIGRPGLSAADATRIRHLLTGAGSRTFAVDLAESHAASARRQIRQAALPPQLEHNLEQLLTAVTTRTR
ncbi:MAG: (2E,6E)-farnesyl diphosphate synthase [Micrococcaceae bacterium]|nr:(2E,6E)-farnesyl diphosphate synthase [Micrococcaceae bacterium]